VRLLVVNGDDFGLSAGVSRGILEAHQQGVLTSTSLMVERPAAAEAARLARSAPKLCVGLHLELEALDPDAAEAALRGQLRRFEQLQGRPPTHLDSHHDVHRDPRVLPRVLETVQPLGIPVRGSSPARRLTRFYGQWGGAYHPEQVGVESLLEMLDALEDGWTELVCHPGHADADLRSSYIDAREWELRTLCDPRVREAIERAGIRLLGFRQLHVGQRLSPWQA
jgi:predicted glycoside hydrolase/deacetylase ChbG (UPF0249 family)